MASINYELLNKLLKIKISFNDTDLSQDEYTCGQIVELMAKNYNINIYEKHNNNKKTKNRKYYTIKKIVERKREKILDKIFADNPDEYERFVGKDEENIIKYPKELVLLIINDSDFSKKMMKHSRKPLKMSKEELDVLAEQYNEATHKYRQYEQDKDFEEYYNLAKKGELPDYSIENDLQLRVEETYQKIINYIITDVIGFKIDKNALKNDLANSDFIDGEITAEQVYANLRLQDYSNYFQYPAEENDE
jgi:hypothetical protein